MPLKPTPPLFTQPAVNRKMYRTIPIITGPLKDGIAVGTGCTLFITHNAVANTATDFAHKLHRLPNGWEQILTQGGGTTWASAADQTFWTSTNIRLRSTVASDVVRLIIK